MTSQASDRLKAASDQARRNSLPPGHSLCVCVKCETAAAMPPRSMGWLIINSAMLLLVGAAVASLIHPWLIIVVFVVVFYLANRSLNVRCPSCGSTDLVPSDSPVGSRILNKD